MSYDTAFTELLAAGWDRDSAAELAEIALAIQEQERAKAAAEAAATVH